MIKVIDVIFSDTHGEITFVLWKELDAVQLLNEQTIIATKIRITEFHGKLQLNITFYTQIEVNMFYTYSFILIYKSEAIFGPMRQRKGYNQTLISVTIDTHIPSRIHIYTHTHTSE